MNIEDQSCINCLFHDNDPNNICVRYPPQIYSYGHGRTAIRIDSGFPIVSVHSWCGEWKEKKDDN